MPPTTLGMSACRERRVAGVLALGREGEEEVRAAASGPLALEDAAARPRRSCRGRSCYSSTTSCPRRSARPICSARRDRRSAGPARGCRVSGVGTQMRIASRLAAGARSRRWPRSCRSRAMARATSRAVEVLDVALAALERFDLRRVDVEAEHRKPASAKGQRQRQADVAQADDADQRLARSILLSRCSRPAGSAGTTSGIGFDIALELGRTATGGGTVPLEHMSGRG